MPRESAAVALRLLKAHGQAVDPAQEPWIHLRVAEEGLLASRNRLLAAVSTQRRALAPPVTETMVISTKPVGNGDRGSL